MGTLYNFKGIWRADTNSPVLTDGVGTLDDIYLINNGTQGAAFVRNLGSGNTTWIQNQYALYTGSVWVCSLGYSPGGSGGITSIAPTNSTLTFTPNPITSTGTIGLNLLNANIWGANITAPAFITTGGLSTQFVKGNGSLDSTTYMTSGVTSVALSLPSAFSVAGSPITSAGTITVSGAGTLSQYISGAGTLLNFPPLTSGTVTSVSGVLNQITVSSGTTTPFIGIASTYIGQPSITTVGALTSGAVTSGCTIYGSYISLGSDVTGDLYYRNSLGYLTRLGIGTTGQLLTVSGGLPTWQTSGATGTVTSIGLALPVSVFTVSGSPITSSGTLTGSFTTQTSGTVFAGPTSGSTSTPTFRALVSSDIPSNVKIGTIGAAFSGMGGTVIIGTSVGIYSNYSGTLTGWNLISAQTSGTTGALLSGACTIGITKNGSNIINSGIAPTLSSQSTNSGTNMTNWTTSFSIGDYFVITISGITTCTTVSFSLTYNKS